MSFFFYAGQHGDMLKSDGDFGCLFNGQQGVSPSIWGRPADAESKVCTCCQTCAGLKAGRFHLTFQTESKKTSDIIQGQNLFGKSKVDAGSSQNTFMISDKEGQYKFLKLKADAGSYQTKSLVSSYPTYTSDDWSCPFATPVPQAKDCAAQTGNKMVKLFTGIKDIEGYTCFDGSDIIIYGKKLKCATDKEAPDYKIIDLSQDGFVGLLIEGCDLEDALWFSTNENLLNLKPKVRKSCDINGCEMYSSSGPPEKKRKVETLEQVRSKESYESTGPGIMDVLVPKSILKVLANEYKTVVTELSQLAMGDFNEKNGSDYKAVMVVNWRRWIVAGTLYDMVFEAVCKDATENALEIFEASVYRRFDGKTTVKYCRKKPTQVCKEQEMEQEIGKTGLVGAE